MGAQVAHDFRVGFAVRLLGAGALLALTAVALPAVALDCENWNTKAFFVSATRAIIQDCLDSGADPNARGTWGHVDGVTPLHWVAERADITVINMLLDAGANPKTPNELGWTPLHMAVWGLLFFPCCWMLVLI